MARVVTSPAVRRLIIGSAISSVGTGFVLPLLLIYLHRVRHIPLATTGLLMAIPGVVGLLVVPLAGSLTDRIGAKRVLAASLLALALAEIGMAFVTDARWAAAVLLLRGAAISPTFPALNTMLGTLADGHAQQRAFALNFTFINAAIGIGGLVGSALIDVGHPWSFQLMFFGDAIASAIAAFVVLSVSRRQPKDDKSTPEARPPGSYRQVLREPALRRFVVVTLLLALCGYAALDSGLPAYANVVAGVSPRIVALSLAANTLTIVALQLAVLKLLRGRRRSRAIAVVGIVWCGSWLLFGLSALPHSIEIRSGGVLLFAAAFGFGECFMAPSVSPLINALATEDTRGRANALLGGMFSIAFVVSPAISAGLISAGLGGAWIGLLCAGCLVVTLSAVRLAQRLRPDQDIAQDIAEDGDDNDLIEPFAPDPLAST
jgi:MFS family permease